MDTRTFSLGIPGLLVALSAAFGGGELSARAVTAGTTQVVSEIDPLVSKSAGLGKESTVLLVMSPDCTICVESMDFYKSLLAQPRMDGTARRFVVLAQGGVVPVDAMLKRNGLNPHGLTSGPASVRDVRDVPTLVVLDASGKRRGTWAGRLTPGQEKEVLAAVVGK